MALALAGRTARRVRTPTAQRSSIRTIMPDLTQALQDTFLRHVREHKVPVTVFLANGIRLQGTVTAFDTYSVLLVRDRQAQVVYKHAISTILPSEPVRTGRTDEPEPSPA
jgi:host factor-I protein